MLAFAKKEDNNHTNKELTMAFEVFPIKPHESDFLRGDGGCVAQLKLLKTFRMSIIKLLSKAAV